MKRNMDAEKMEAKKVRVGTGSSVVWVTVLAFFLVMASVVPGQGALIINEFLADPAPGLAGDANGDGISDATDDEFVEIVNTDATSVDLSGWSLLDGVGVKHFFSQGSVLCPQCPIVVFGGGILTGPFPDNALVQTASTGTLGLNNTSDTVTLKNGDLVVAQYTYGNEAGGDKSLSRNPDLTGDFVPHPVLDGHYFSPGRQVNGEPFSASVPLPGAALLLGSGFCALMAIGRRTCKP